MTCAKHVHIRVFVVVPWACPASLRDLLKGQYTNLSNKD